MEAILIGAIQYLGVIWLETGGYITTATESFFLRLYVMLSSLLFII